MDVYGVDFAGDVKRVRKPALHNLAGNLVYKYAKEVGEKLVLDLVFGPLVYKTLVGDVPSQEELAEAKADVITVHLEQEIDRSLPQVAKTVAETLLTQQLDPYFKDWPCNLREVDGQKIHTFEVFVERK